MPTDDEHDHDHESHDHDHPIDAPGWDVIDRWVGSHFVGQVPHQFSSQTAYELDSPNPLPAITVWQTKAPKGWLYVTYGLSELFDKTSGDPSMSGFGFELSLRIPGLPGEAPADAQPPVWPLRMLQSIGSHILNTGEGFDSGHAIDLGGSLVPPDSDGPADSKLTGLLCLPDPVLGKIDTIHGSLLFMRLFGVTEDELAIMVKLDLGSLVACVAELSPMAVTDPQRGSFADDPQRSKVLTRYKLGIKL
jgi:hypothetical protein